MGNTPETVDHVAEAHLDIAGEIRRIVDEHGSNIPTDLQTVADRLLRQAIGTE